LAAVYVPGVLLLAGLFSRGGTSFQRDYSPLLVCAGMAWIAANLPLVVARWVLPNEFLPWAALAVSAYFLFLMFFAVRVVFGAGNGTAVAVVGLSWIPLLAVVFLWGPLRMILGWIASPFFLFYLYYYLGSEIGGLGAGLRNRQHFHRMLEAAAVNPHDGEAQYQLGLIYQERRQYTEAIARFQKAIAIDPTETDAYFQLGRIAREQCRTDDALGCFRTVLKQDPKHHQSEILRELGAAYLASGQYEEARRQLEEYVDRHPYDPEGLFEYGQALEQLGQKEPARAAYQQAIEAARTAPRYRRNLVGKWSRMAEKRLR
jgi:tetratricopeptide (TPR) repeat protein